MSSYQYIVWNFWSLPTFIRRVDLIGIANHQTDRSYSFSVNVQDMFQLEYMELF